MKWRVFYADDTNIYLIAEDYVENKYLTSTGLAKSTRTNPWYGSDIANWNDYCVYSNTSRQDLIDRLTNTSYYTDFKDSSNKALSVVGAATLEQFKTSYNAVNTDVEKQIDLLYCVAGQNYNSSSKASAEGYALRFGNGGDYEQHILVPDDVNKRDLYIRASYENAYAMWLASFSIYSTNNLIYVDYFGYVPNYGNNGKAEYGHYQNDSAGLRPLVTLNYGVKLVDPDGDGVYDLQ